MSEKEKHWAESLKKGNRAIATIRHATDGTKNRHNIVIVVMENSVENRTIHGFVFLTGEDVCAKYSDLSKVAYKQFENTVDIKIDRSTLPKDRQKVAFQDLESEDWHEGYFVEGDDLFFINPGHWYNSFNVLCWCDISNIKHAAT